MNIFLNKKSRTEETVCSMKPSIVELEEFFKPKETSELQTMTYTFVLKKQKK